MVSPESGIYLIHAHEAAQQQARAPINRVERQRHFGYDQGASQAPIRRLMPPAYHPI